MIKSDVIKSDFIMKLGIILHVLSCVCVFGCSVCSVAYNLDTLTLHLWNEN